MQKKIPFIFWLLTVIFLFIHGSHHWTTRTTKDYFQYWVVGEAIKTLPVKDIYILQDRIFIKEKFIERALNEKNKSLIWAVRYRENLELPGTPVLYGVVRLLSSGNYDLDFRIFETISFYFWVCGITILCRLFRYSFFQMSLFLIFLTFFSYPYASDVEVGNVNQLQLGCFSFILFLLMEKKDRAAFMIGGFLLGGLFSFKPNFIQIGILWAGWWFLNKDFKKLWTFSFGVIAGIIVCGAVSQLYMGEACRWFSWGANFEDNIHLYNYWHVSFLRNFFDGLSNLIFAIFNIAELIAVFLALTFLVAKNKRSGKDKTTLVLPLLFMTGIVIYLLASPIAHRHYFLMTTPMMLFAFRPGFFGWESEIRTDLFRFVAGLVGSFFILFFNRLTTLGIGARPHTYWYYIGTLILFIPVVTEFKKLSYQQPHESSS